MAAMSNKIVVAGDVAIDWLAWPIGSQDEGDCDQARMNWELMPGHRMVALGGGALLLADLVRAATQGPVHTHIIDSKLEETPPEQVIHSLAFLSQFPFSADTQVQAKVKQHVYRIQKLHGFVGPAKGSPPPVALTSAGDFTRKPDMIVLDDAGNGFRDCPQVWPEALTSRKAKPLVLMKMSRPLGCGPLWDLITSRHADRLVVVVNANDLRMIGGVNISRGLSWEQTAGDLAWQLANNPRLAPLARLGHLIVRCGLDGAVHYTCRRGRPASVLHYDSIVAEGGFGDEHPGQMLGHTSAFVAAIAARMIANGPEAVGEGVREGILASRRMLVYGFGQANGAVGDQRQFRPAYPSAKVFAAMPGERQIFQVSVPQALARRNLSTAQWSILHGKEGHLEELACQIVRNGMDNDSSGLSGIPIARFGHLRTAVLSEIESYRSIRNIIHEYRQSGTDRRPLSIAVFGPPGSGKSFGVKQVAAGVARGEVETVEFNVSQFTKLEDLVRALHRVHDKALTGRLPLVFFDEFDSPLANASLGWLKYFLAPMQDGVFRDGEADHPIGKAIFVFAGGTCSSFAAFCREDASPAEQAEFRQKKGPDFVSRLRGHIDIMGPNPLNEQDSFAMIRRAVVLRSLLEAKARTLRELSGQSGCLIDGHKHALIDEGVLRAFIKAPRYKHGTRSMEAIMDMSTLAGRRHFEQAALPPAEQLDLHVDAQAFYRLVSHDVLFGAARDRIAKAFHERYRQDQAPRQRPSARAMCPWDELAEDLKESNRQEADHIPDKLKAVGYVLSPLSDGRARVAFTRAEVEKLARMEHERWMAAKLATGMRYARRKDPVARTHPSLVPWERLSEREREKDRVAVRAIPGILRMASFTITRSQ